MARKVTKDIPISKLIRQLLNDADLKIDDVSEVINKNVESLRNKLSSGSFSLVELISIIGMVDGTIEIHTAKNDYNISPEEFCGNELYSSIEAFKEKRKQKKIKMLEEAIQSTDPDTVKKIFEKYINNKGDVNMEKIY